MVTSTVLRSRINGSREAQDGYRGQQYSRDPENVSPFRLQKFSGKPGQATEDFIREVELAPALNSMTECGLWLLP